MRRNRQYQSYNWFVLACAHGTVNVKHVVIDIPAEFIIEQKWFDSNFIPTYKFE